MASGANDRRGLVQRIRDAREAYRGPFSGADVAALLEQEGYEAIGGDDGNAFLIYRKDGCKPVPLDSDWNAIYDDDPIFRCVQRDLGFSRSKLRTLLNRARDGR